MNEITERNRVEESSLLASGAHLADATVIHVLDRVSATLTETGLELGDLMQSLARLLTEIVGDVCFIRVYSPETKKLMPIGFHAAEPELGEVLRKIFSSSELQPNSGVTAEAFRDRRTVRYQFTSIEEAKSISHPQYHEIMMRERVGCVIATPLVYRGESVGSIVLARRDQRPVYTEWDERLLRGIADRASITIQNAKLYGEARQAREQASEIAERLRLISDAMPALISYIDSSLVYRFVNIRYEDVYCLKREQIIGKPMHKVLRPETFEVLRPKVVEALTGKTVRFESQFVLKNGEGRYFEITYMPHFRGSEVDGVYAFANDITSRKESELEIQRNVEALELARMQAEAARQSAEAGNRAKDVFLATLSHELRTPLTTILSYAQMLRMGLISADNQKRAIEMIEQSSLTQAQLINDLLDISRITMGKLILTFSDVDAVALMNTTIESIRPQLAQKSLELVQEFSVPSLFMRADPVRLKQIYLNLLTNAIKFSNVGGKIRIFLKKVSDPSSEYLELHVQDDGKGIRADFLPHIFDRFRQADSSTTRAHGGMGLGLAIVRALVEQHNGSVFAHSEGEGKGATLSARIPLNPDGRYADHCSMKSSSNTISGETSSDSHVARLDGIRIVLVEDDRCARESLELLLKSLGAHIRSAASAGEGMKALIEERPDVLISDISMPGEDGHSLIRKVRKLDPQEGGLVPSIALTAFAGIDDAQRALSAGFHSHLSKPINANQLAQSILRLLKSR